MTATGHDIQPEAVCEVLRKLTAFSNQIRNVQRKVWFRGRDVGDPERVGEHCFQLERFAWFLNEHLKLGLDPLLIFQYCHVHDDVEYIDGDTPAFAPRKDRAQLELFRTTKIEREAKAVAGIESEWGVVFPSYTARVRGYEAQKDRESRFVKALDKIMGSLNDLDDNWRSAHILELTLEEHDAYKRPRVQCDPVIAQLYDVLYALMKETYVFKEMPKEASI